MNADNPSYLSYYYTSRELPRRLSFFWVAFQSTQIVSAFLAYGILRLRGVNGLYGWQWLFALEGMLTGLIGVFAWFYLPASPYDTASWFRGKHGWFNEREEKIIANRIIRDDPSKGDMHNREGLSWSMLKDCLKDYHMWPLYLLGLSWTIPNVSWRHLRSQEAFTDSTADSSRQLLDVESEGVGIWDLPNQFANHPCVRSVHRTTPLLDLDIGEVQSALPAWRHRPTIFSSASDRSRSAPVWRLTLGQMVDLHNACWVSLHSRHSRRHSKP